MDREKETLIFRDCVYANQTLYFFSENINKPIKYNLQNSSSAILPYNDFGSHIDLEAYYGGVLYALETGGENLVKYDLDNFNCELIFIGCNNKKDGNYAYLYCWNNKVYIFTREQQVLVIYDVVCDIVERIMYPDDVSDYYITGCKFRNSCFVFPKNGNVVLEYDFLRNKWERHRLDIDLVNCIHVIVDDDIYILLSSGRIYKWNCRLDAMEVITNAEKVYHGEHAASRLCLTIEEIIVLPAVEQDIVKINRINNKTSIYKEYPENFSYDPDRKNWSKYYGYCESETDYYFACRTSKYILKVEKHNGKISWINSKISRAEIFRVYLERNNNLVYEGEKDLELFIRAM